MGGVCVCVSLGRACLGGWVCCRGASGCVWGEYGWVVSWWGASGWMLSVCVEVSGQGECEYGRGGWGGSRFAKRVGADGEVTAGRGGVTTMLGGRGCGCCPIWCCHQFVKPFLLDKGVVAPRSPNPCSSELSWCCQCVAVFRR